LQLIGGIWLIVTGSNFLFKEKRMTEIYQNQNRPPGLPDQSHDETNDTEFDREITGTHLLRSLQIRDVTFRNRIAMSPMCQYSAEKGLANDWHLVHLGSRAVGGAALVMVEATAVTPDGRISPGDLGIWGDQHVEPLARIARFIHAQGLTASSPPLRQPLVELAMQDFG
jgi:hypothetical protein